MGTDRGDAESVGANHDETQWGRAGHPEMGKIRELAPPTDIASWRGITKSYGALEAVARVDLSVARGEFFTLLGPSGSGKSTLLHIMAGLIAPTAGSVAIEGKDVTGEPPYRRNLGMVFQSLALFPHMDVFSNVAFPLRMRRVGRGDIARRVRSALEMVRLPGVEGRHISELSGGQRQRIALARALVYESPLLLLDEPLGALDRRLREDMQVELLRLHRDLDVTIVNVTHDQREALMLSDRIGIIENGRILQVATPEALYRAPATSFVASFIGDPVRIEGRVVSEEGRRWLMRDDLRFAVMAGDELGPGTLVLRSESVSLVRDEIEASRYDNRLQAQVELAAFEGTGMYYEVGIAGHAITAKVFAQGTDRLAQLEPGDRAWLVWNAVNAPVLVDPAAAGS
jgi:putative spermidine/putrescine transport system ATP-binding protein